jgi:hypothetical protein
MMKGIYGMTLKERLEAKSMPIPESGCILWIGAWKPYKYGELNYKRKICDAHRLAWKAYVGEIPEGMCVLHKCDVPPCINPNHLYLGTQKDNAHDREERDRGNHVALKGSLNGSSKLNEDDVLKIRADTRSQRKIALEYGVERTTIRHIKQGRTWQHI